VSEKDLVYSALLTPQGKYLYDFFLFKKGSDYFLDIKTNSTKELITRLAMYQLRAKVELNDTKLKVSRGLNATAKFVRHDPRCTALGWRHYSEEKLSEENVDWELIRVMNCIPETGVELIQNKTFILEAGFERINGVDFNKGCFVGQEVTARMKHKTTLRKGLARVIVKGSVRPGSTISVNGNPVGILYTQSNNMGIAYLNFDRAIGKMEADGVEIRNDPKWAFRP